MSPSQHASGADRGTGDRRPGFDTALRLALEEARRGDEGLDVPVGAVVLDPEGRAVGRGRNEREATGDPTAHAEVVALRAAAARAGRWRLDGHTMAVTLEPCTMCAGALVLARVATLVYGARDEKAGAVGSLWDVVRDPRLNHRLEVIPPDLVSPEIATDCAQLLIRFFAQRRLG